MTRPSIQPLSCAVRALIQAAEPSTVVVGQKERHLAVVKKPSCDAADEEPFDAALARRAGANQGGTHVFGDSEKALRRVSRDEVGLNARSVAPEKAPLIQS